MALTVSVCFLCLSETLVGSGGVYRRFLRTKTCAQTNRVGCTTNVLQDVRRTADASRLSQGFRAKEPSVDPTQRVNMSVFLRGSLHCELARRSAKIQQEAQLSPRDRAMRRVS